MRDGMDPMTALAGKVIVVTGAGGGIGQTYAEAIVAAGGRAVVNDLDAERAAVVAYALGERASHSGHDVTEWAQAEELIDRCIDRWGGSTDWSTMPGCCGWRTASTRGRPMPGCSNPAVITPPATTTGTWDIAAVDRAFSERLRAQFQPCGVRLYPG